MDWIGQLTRLPYARGLWKRFPVGPLDLRMKWGILPEYPPYAYGVYFAAMLASHLGIARISVLELGVAGGRGLLALERIAAEVEQRFGVAIDVIGFDTGQGMPDSLDYRDLQHVWSGGFYRMDADKLRQRLTRAQLVLGDIAGPEYACMNDHVGELLAIREFNAAHATRKVCQIHNLRCARKRDEPWYAQVYAFHDFEHPLYTVNVAPKTDAWSQLPI